MKRHLRFETLEIRRALAAHILDIAPHEDAGTALVRTIEGLKDSEDAETIVIPAGLYELPASAQGGSAIAVSNRLTLVGANPAETIIKAPDGQRAFSIEVGAQLGLDGLTLYSGDADKGGAISNLGDLQLNQVSIHAGYATQGGQIYNAGTATLSNVVLVGGTAFIGGAVQNEGDLVASDTLFVGNHIVPYLKGGGAINNHGSLVLESSVLTANVGGFSGGGIANDGTVQLVDTVIVGNSADRGGGFAEFQGRAIDAVGSIIVGNSSNADYLGDDIAVMKRGVENTTASPAVSSLGDLAAADEILRVRTPSLVDGTFSGPADLVGVNFPIIAAEDGNWQVGEHSSDLRFGVVWSPTTTQFSVIQWRCVSARVQRYVGPFSATLVVSRPGYIAGLARCDVYRSHIFSGRCRHCHQS